MILGCATRIEVRRGVYVTEIWSESTIGKNGYYERAIHMHNDVYSTKGWNEESETYNYKSETVRMGTGD